jgi:hypothetical protein
MLQSFFNATHNHKHLKTGEANTALGRTVLPHTHYTSHILLPRFFTSLKPSKIPSVEKGFGIDEEVNEKVKKLLRLQKSNWHKNDLVARWPKAVDVDGDCVEK